MRAAQLSLDEQMTCLREALELNRTLGEVLSGAAAMNLPGWYLVAGCLYQTVWNVITGQPPEAASSTTTWSTSTGRTCPGVRLEPGGRWRIYAPYGLSDVFNLVIRPNPVLATRDVYEAKTVRWTGQWPGLTVIPWPATTDGSADPQERAQVGGDPQPGPLGCGAVVHALTTGHPFSAV
jgi:hypothetical protein